MKTNRIAPPSSASWQGPIQVKKVATDSQRPSESPGVYIVSKRGWSGRPTADAGILYVGKSDVLRWRVGALVAVLLGFGPEADRPREQRYLHGKGRRIFHEECHSNVAESARLYIGWRYTRFFKVRAVASRDCQSMQF